VSYQLSQKSLDKLHGVSFDLVQVVKRAIELTDIDFGVSEGVRTLDRQKELFDARKSRTMNSRHLTGDAVDLYAHVDGKASWKPRYYDYINDAMQEAALELGIAIRWGGDWDGDGDRTDQTFNDLCHWELPA